MNYYCGCGHFVKYILYKWNKKTVLLMFIITICSHNVNGIQYSIQRMTGIGEIFG